MDFPYFALLGVSNLKQPGPLLTAKPEHFTILTFKPRTIRNEDISRLGEMIRIANKPG